VLTGDRFWKHMLPSMPILSFGRHGADFETVRRQEPTLFLSMIAAAASTLRIPDMFEKLQKEAISIITYNAVVEGQKTAELLLSLLVLTFWPIAPARYALLKSYLKKCGLMAVQVRPAEDLLALSYVCGDGG